MDSHEALIVRSDAVLRFEDSHGPCAEDGRNADAVGTACDRACICQSRSPACPGLLLRPNAEELRALAQLATTLADALSRQA